MKIARWYNNRDIRIEEVPKPDPGPGEMLLQVMSCGICGSDVVEWYRLPRAPLVPGHEIGGRVVAVGAGTTKFKTGDRVFVAPKVPCLHCRYCRNGHFAVCPHVTERLPGGLAEYLLVPQVLVENGAYRLSDSISYDHSTMIEPLACAIRAQHMANLQAGQRVMIMGCGMSGLLHVKLAKIRHCRIIAVDINSQRLDVARNLGAEVVIAATEDLRQRLIDENIGQADTIILCTSALSAVRQAWQCIDIGGCIVFFAVPGPDKEVTIPITQLWTKAVKVLTSYYCGPPDIIEAIDLIDQGTVEVQDMITHRLPLQDAAQGFALVAGARESIKVIIKPNG